MSWGSRDQGPQTRDQKKQVCSPPGWRPEVHIKASAGPQGNTFFVSSSSWQPWRPLTCGHIPPVCASVSSGPLPCLFLTNFSLLTRNQAPYTGAHAALTQPPLYLWLQGSISKEGHLHMFRVDMYFRATFHPSLMDQWERKCLPMQERQV